MMTSEEDYEYLHQLGLRTSTHNCWLRVGEEDEREEEKEYPSRDSPQSSLSSSSSKSTNELNGHGGVGKTRLVVRIPKIPEEKRDRRLGHERALAFSILGEKITDISIPEFVHVKWATDIEGLNFLFHEAQMYETLRKEKIDITPKFYGYYQKYPGTDLFAASVFERCSTPHKPLEMNLL